MGSIPSTSDADPGIEARAAQALPTARFPKLLPMRRVGWYAWKFGLPLLVAAAVGYYFYDKLRRPELWTDSFRLRVEWLVPAALLYLCAHCVWGTFSVILLRNQGATVSLRT